MKVIWNKTHDVITTHWPILLDVKEWLVKWEFPVAKTEAGIRCHKPSQEATILGLHHPIRDIHNNKAMLEMGNISMGFYQISHPWVSCSIIYLNHIAKWIAEMCRIGCWKVHAWFQHVGSPQHSMVSTCSLQPYSCTRSTRNNFVYCRKTSFIIIIRFFTKNKPKTPNPKKHVS